MAAVESKPPSAGLPSSVGEGETKSSADDRSICLEINEPKFPAESLSLLWEVAGPEPPVNGLRLFAEEGEFLFLIVGISLVSKASSSEVRQIFLLLLDVDELKSSSNLEALKALRKVGLSSLLDIDELERSL